MMASGRPMARRLVHVVYPPQDPPPGAVGGIDPGNTGALAIEPVQGWRRAIEPLEVAHQAVHPGVQWVVEALPVEPEIVVPLALLAEFAAHEQELLAGMRPHEGEIGPQIGEALPAAARHPADQRPLAVDDLGMGERQDAGVVGGIAATEATIVLVVFAGER